MHALVIMMLSLRVGSFNGTVDHSARDGDTWTLRVSTTSRTPTELVIPLTIRGGTVTSMSLTIAGETLASESLPVIEAREAFREIVDTWEQDPALLEYVPSPTNDRYRLRVFPVVRGVPAIIRIKFGPTSAVTPEQSLIARYTHWEDVQPQVVFEETTDSLGTRFHKRVAAVPDVDSGVLTGATRPKRAVDRALVQIVADQDELGPPRRVAPRADIAQLGTNTRTLDKSSAVLAR